MIGDLHNHSNHSDGIYSVQEVISRALHKGIGLIALTDHDSIDGNFEVLSGPKLPIQFIPGIELSTRTNDESIHILGYFKKRDLDVPELINYLREQKEHREMRSKKMIELLKSEFNIEIDFEDIKKESKGIIARPHIAQAIIDKGYPYSKAYIFDHFISKGCKAYVPSTFLSTEEGIGLLKRNHCIVVLAHPVLIKKTPIETFIKMGLDGLEAKYPSNNLNDTAYFMNLAKENNLLITGGSDFHGFMDKTHHEIGTQTIDGKYLEAFLKRIEG